MSQDMMQALSGSSLLSLSIGTLPAVKAGMTLDANPFASQLALMTGTDSSVAGMAAPVAVATGLGEGAFAAALTDLVAPAPAAPQTSDVAAPALPEPARPLVAPEAPIVAALPADANTSQLIEAALTGAATIAQAPHADALPRAAAAAPLAAAEREPVAAPVPQGAQPWPIAASLPHASDVPHLKNLIRADAPMPIRAQLADDPEAEPAGALPDSPVAPHLRERTESADQPVASDALPVQAMPIAVTPTAPATPRLEAPVTDLATTSVAAEASLEAQRPAVAPQVAPLPHEMPLARHAAASPVADTAQPLAAPSVQPMQVSTDSASIGQALPSHAAAPLVDRPVVAQPHLAASPIAAEKQVSAVAQPVAPEVAAEPPHVRKARIAREPGQVAQPAGSEILPAQPGQMAAPAVATTTQQMAAEAAPITTIAPAAPRHTVAASRQPTAPRHAVAAPLQPAASQTADRTIADPSVTPMTHADATVAPPAMPQPIGARSSAPVEARQPVAVQAPVEATAAQTVAATTSQPGSESLAAAQIAPSVPAQSLAASAPATPRQTTAEAVPAQPRQQEPAPQATATMAIAPDDARVVQAAPIAMAAPAQAPRQPVSAAARRTIDAAMPTARRSDLRSSIMDGAELSVGSAMSTMAAEPVAPGVIDVVPPAWAAALNAVNGQVQQVTGAAAPQAATQPQVPVHHLAFDAGFVAGIESQIARLADGGQTVKIQVMPEHLGRIDIDMLAGPDRDQIRIVTEHDAVRETLASSQHRLEQDLRSNGQRNTEVTVELRQQSPGTQNGSAQQQQQRGQSGAEGTSARDAAQRQPSADQTSDTNPAPRRPRGNVRYA